MRSTSSSESFARGNQLFQAGAVFDTYRQGDLLTARCEGSSAPYYQVRLTIDEGGIQEASCTCPYDWGGYCKHIIAVMLAYIHDPETFAEQKRVEDLVSSLNKEALVRLIAALVEKNPDLYFLVQTILQSEAVKATPEQSHQKRKTQVSKSEYRRQIQSILHGLDGYRRSEAYWMMSGMVEQLHTIRDSAYAFLKAGDAEGAIVILTTLLTEVSGSYEEFDDSDGELGSFLDELALPMVEAILSADLSKSERNRLAKELEPMINNLSDYGIDELDVILTALKKGWSHERIIDAEEEDFDDEILVEAQLNVLERQNRLEEFLQLCLETGQYLRYILKQIETGAFDQAVEMAWKTLTMAEDALQVAKGLRAAGRLEDALRLAEKGLGLDGSKRNLGAWLGPVEEAQGRTGQALQAYQAAFASLPSLELYQTLKKLSSKDWEAMKPALMRVFDGDRFAEEQVDIFLFEQEWDAAIAVADRVGDWQYNLVEKVADGVISVRPDWVIQASQKQAQALIDKTQSKYYSIAAHWLAKVKQAYLSTGRKAEWQGYLDGLKSTYSRRPALQAELKKL
ncbi:MAG TPA: SWIM zinc finger family protein [Anaerolineaceae bacterium]|nr:SWIM zinc finger family protein [Anaerolineaceae bacterium]